LSEYLTVESRFHGPPDAGNGGYVAGLLARFIGDPAQVTLRRPAPLDRPLEVVRRDSQILLQDGTTLIAEAVPGPTTPSTSRPADSWKASTARRSFSA